MATSDKVNSLLIGLLRNRLGEEEVPVTSLWFPYVHDELVTASENICVSMVSGNTVRWLVVTRNYCGDNELPMTVKLDICSNGKYTLRVFDKVVTEGTVATEDITSDTAFWETVERVKSRSHILCPGIVKYGEYREKLRYTPKSVRSWVNIVRHDAHGCLLLHKQSKPIRRSEYEDVCDVCRHRILILKKQAARGLTDERERKATLPSSKRPLCFLSEETLAKKLKHVRSERAEYKRLLEKLRAQNADKDEDQRRQQPPTET